MPNSFIDDAIFPWVKKNKFPPTDSSDAILVIALPTAASSDADGPVQWSCSMTTLEIKTVWDPVTELLHDTSVSIEIPGFGYGPLLSPQTIDMKASTPISVAIPDTGLFGVIQFCYGSLDTKDDCITLKWKIYRPWFGTPVDDYDEYPLFPTNRSSSFLDNKLQNVRVITDSEVSALKETPLSKFKVVGASSDIKLIQFDTSPDDTFQQKIVASFMHDHVGPGNAVVTVPALSGPKSEGNTFDISFHGYFQLVGTILAERMQISGGFYVKIPFIGPVKLAELKGTLTSGVRGEINSALAEGYVKVKTFQNDSGRHELYLDELESRCQVAAYTFNLRPGEALRTPILSQSSPTFSPVTPAAES